MGARDDKAADADLPAAVTSHLPAHLMKLVDLLPLNQPVHRTTLEEQYGKSNYARRIRKIVAEYGWDIERTRGSNGANDDWYLRKSDGPVRVAHIRREVSPKVRPLIYKRDNWTCKMCGTAVGDSQADTRAQCDHKVPAERGGASLEANLQTLCLQCNLKKRQACRHCTLPSCQPCPYAYPEKFASVLVLRLGADVASKLGRMADSRGVPPAIFLTQLVEQASHLIEEDT